MQNTSRGRKMKEKATLKDACDFLAWKYKLNENQPTDVEMKEFDRKILEWKNVERSRI